MITSLAIAGLIVFLFLALSMVWPPDSPWAPWWRTNKQKALEICKLAKISKTDIVFDLGCGDGEVLLQAGIRGAKGIGIEIDPIRAYIAKFKILQNKLTNKIEIRRENFFNTDLSEASVVIVYLIPKTLEKLKPKFNRELKKGTKIVSFIYEIKGLKLYKKDLKNKLYLYTI